MKLAAFSIDGRTRLGAVVGERIVDLTVVGAPATMLELIQAGPEAWVRVDALGGAAGAPSFPLGSVRLLAPLPNPPKIVAIGLNYMDHCREQNVPVPDKPLVFAKFPSSIIGPGEDIVWDPAMTQQVDLEGELAFVIGARARNVRAEDAYAVIAGYVCLNDVTARDLQFGDRQWVRGKSLDTFCPIGPWIRTRDEVPDPHALGLLSERNGTVMQDSSTSLLIHKVPALVEFITRAFTLLPGDVVATGTPSGVGVFRKPPVFLQDGDVIAVEVEGLGRLENPCRAVAAG